MQHLVHVTTRCYGLATTTRPYQRNVKTGTSIYQRPTDLSCPRRLSNCIQRLDRSQLTRIKHLAVSPRLDLRQQPSSNVLLRTSTTWPYQLTTWPILAEDHIQPPRTFTYTFVIPANKIVTFVVSIISPFVSLHCLWLAHTYTHAYYT